MVDLADRRVHFMGIGGIGMSALALMAHHYGARVSGCDRAANTMTRLVEDRGIPFTIGHSPAHAQGVDLLVYSSAIPTDHPECKAAAATEKRGAFLARLLNRSVAYGVGGTHGKTTTSWILAHILLTAGLDPSVCIGGEVESLPGRNHRLGSGPFVAELDESDGSFLLPTLAMAVVTNIESEHLSHYGSDEALYQAFRRFAHVVAGKGTLVANADDPISSELFADHQGLKLTFGMTPGADVTASRVRTGRDGSRFTLGWQGTSREVHLPLMGIHNVSNALAAAAAALAVGVPLDTVAKALASATGVGRRMELLGLIGDAAVYSDYAHHPTEVAAAIAGVRQRHGGKILTVFQPHLYSRTRDYADAFGAALAASDRILLAELYPAREEPIPGVDAGMLVEAVKRRGGDVHGPLALDELADAVADLSAGFEAVLMMGAGSIDGAARAMAHRGRGMSRL